MKNLFTTFLGTVFAGSTFFVACFPISVSAGQFAKGKVQFTVPNGEKKISLPKITDPVDDKLNWEIAHEHYFGEDFNVGYGPDGFFSYDQNGIEVWWRKRDDNGNVVFEKNGKELSNLHDAKFENVGKPYDDSTMLKAFYNLANAKPPQWEATKNENGEKNKNGYSVTKHNCQHFADALRKEYWRLIEEQEINAENSEQNPKVSDSANGSTGMTLIGGVEKNVVLDPKSPTETKPTPNSNGRPKRTGLLKLGPMSAE